MHQVSRAALVVLAAGLVLTACSNDPDDDNAAVEEIAHLEPIEGQDVSRVILSAGAADRLDIHTTEVRNSAVAADGAARLVIPYAAVIYDADGNTWTYTSPEPLTFVRESVTVDTIEGQQALLSSGPAVGTAVVTVGVSELFGTEYEVGH